jgi:hypothetical protein
VEAWIVIQDGLKWAQQVVSELASPVLLSLGQAQPRIP